MLSHYVILLYPSIPLVFIILFLHGVRLCLGFFCWVQLFFGSNSLPISLNIPSYPFTQQWGKKLHTFSLEPNTLCKMSSELNHYSTILNIRHCFLLVYVTDAGAAADTRRWRSPQREPVPLRRWARSRRRCWPADATDIRRPHPPPSTPLPAPRSHRRRRRSRYPAAAQPTTGACAAAATGPEPTPPSTGAGGRRIWGRGNKNTVAYPFAEQDRQKRVRPSRRASRRARTGAGLTVAP